MSRWFRHYAGMMRDAKLVTVSVRSKQPIERVVWVWGAILESAAEINDNGKYELDPGEVAYFLRCDESDVASVLAGLESCQRVADGVVLRWGDRQFSSDSAAERQRRYRERKANGDARNGNDNRNGDAQGDVTPPSRDAVVTPQETEIDTELEKKKTKRARGALDGFAEWYALYPNKVQRGAAEKAWPKARAIASQAELVDGLARYIASKPPDRAWQNPATWLNGKGWLDQPATPTGQGPPAKAPQMADVFKFIGTHGHEPEPADDSSSVRPAISYLSAVGSGRGS